MKQLLVLRFLTSLFACSNPKTSHEEHAQRFLDPKESNYTDAHHRALLIIGSQKERVKGPVEGVAACMKDKDKQGSPQIIGLVVSLTHDSYEMYVPGKDPIFLVCDRVAKSLGQDEHGHLIAAQSCAFLESDEGPPRKQDKRAPT